MNPLPSKLRKNGFNYELVHRQGRVCIYKQMVTETLYYYEIFVVKVRPARTLYDKYYPEKEAFPANSQFGCSAWSYRSFQDAERKFEELVNIDDNPKQEQS